MEPNGEGQTSSDQLISEVHEFDALWTSNLTQKLKKWNDGVLRFHAFNRRAMLYDSASGALVDNVFLSKPLVQEGEEIRMDHVLVTVESKRQIVLRDIAPIYEKSAGPRDYTHQIRSSTDIITARTSTSNVGDSRSTATPLMIPSGTQLRKGPSLGPKRRRIVPPTSALPVHPTPREVPVSWETLVWLDGSNRPTDDKHSVRRDPPNDMARSLETMVKVEPIDLARIHDSLPPVPAAPLPASECIAPITTFPRQVPRPVIGSRIALSASDSPTLGRPLPRGLVSIQHPVPRQQEFDSTEDLELLLSQTLDNLQEYVTIDSSGEDSDGCPAGDALSPRSPLLAIKPEPVETTTVRDASPAVAAVEGRPLVTIQPAGPWTQDALELFSFRPPGL